VVAVATDSPVVEKVLSNMEEVRARGADVIAVATEGDQAVTEVADQTLYVPRSDWILQPILAVVRSSCSPITSLARTGSTSTSPGISQRPSLSSRTPWPPSAST